jgi:hypothetical protein
MITDKVHVMNSYLKMKMHSRKEIAKQLNVILSNEKVNEQFKRERNSIKAQQRLIKRAVELLGKPTKKAAKVFLKQTNVDIFSIVDISDRFRVWKGLPINKSLLEIWNSTSTRNMDGHFKNLFQHKFYTKYLNITMSAEFSYYPQNPANMFRLNIKTKVIDKTIISNIFILDEEIVQLNKLLSVFLNLFISKKLWSPDRDSIRLLASGKPLSCKFQIFNGYTLKVDGSNETRFTNFAFPSSLSDGMKALSRENVYNTIVKYDWSNILTISIGMVGLSAEKSPAILDLIQHKINIISMYS